MNRVIPGTCYAAAAGSVFGAFNQSELITWTGAIIAVGSAVVTALLGGFHKLREAAREERAKDQQQQRMDRSADQQQQLDDVRALGRVQIELETRIAAGTKRLDEIESAMERVRCRYPAADGTARCADPTKAPV